MYAIALSLMVCFAPAPFNKEHRERDKWVGLWEVGYTHSDGKREVTYIIWLGKDGGYWACAKHTGIEEWLPDGSLVYNKNYRLGWIGKWTLVKDPNNIIGEPDVQVIKVIEKMVGVKYDKDYQGNPYTFQCSEMRRIKHIPNK